MADNNTLDLESLNDVTLDDLPSAPPTFPEDDYVVAIREVRARTSQNNKPYVMFSAVVLEGEYTGRRANGMFMLDKDNVWRIKKLLFRPLGVPEDTPLGTALAQLEGVQATAKIGIKNNLDGEPENVLRKVYGPAS